MFCCQLLLTMSLIQCVVLCALLSYAAAATYDYEQVLKYSLLFYEAQRSGKLPADQKVTWRKDSALDDQGENGEDLTGGYYDAGDYMKYGFPMAYTTTVLAWGVINYEGGYDAAGALEDGRKAVKWATDYFLKCHVDDNTFYGQVGKTDLDHDYWGRPEDMTMDRPAYKLDPDNPGSDLIGETAAALAAASIVFKDVDSDYSDKLISHAKQLFDLANDNRGKYTDSIPDAQDSYGSSGYKDELVWAAAWLYKATNDDSYLSQAEDMYDSFNIQDDEGFEWDTKNSGVVALLASLTDSSKYKNRIKTYCDDLINNYDRTPKGLVFIDEWGSLGLVGKSALVCLQAADIGINTDEYYDFAREQIGYMLGDTGRSFVVGFGENYPTHEHHASSSCPDAPATCDWDNFDSDEPNAHILYGALVGGPDQNDKYTDKRGDYVGNEVACDYNAGFQGVIAALVQYDETRKKH